MMKQYRGFWIDQIGDWWYAHNQRDPLANGLWARTGAMLYFMIDKERNHEL